jgi:transposase
MARRDVEGLDAWMEECAGSGLRPFQALAKSFRHDYEAIKQALKTQWSNAQCEGQYCPVTPKGADLAPWEM